MAHLTAASPFTLHNKNMTFKNRFVKSARSERVATKAYLPDADIFSLFYMKYGISVIRQRRGYIFPP
ncbi:hypothetical protein CHL76_06450 [Marinococcus halophilus]|uniref:Uncharacterized protein n=1 Tax=Marinococcus halophilus TaxID=1371 RepID=A0A510Y929_MARHA|nr:hypothetical protein CHL76_06450 [Marinococcus halophilus]GEK58917.1 hypothetical protein MHA01_18220 [Marinococcus halophilus]